MNNLQLKLLLQLFLSLLVSVCNTRDLSASTVGESLVEGVHIRRFDASVFGSEAIWTNPAGLSWYETTTGTLMFDYRDERYRRDWGLALSGRGFGYAYRKVTGVSAGASVGDYKEHTFAYGVSIDPTLDFGLSYRYASSGPAWLHKRHEWNMGLLFRPDGKFSFATTFENLNKASAFGAKTPVNIHYGLAMRPLGTDQLTLNAQAEMTHKESLRRADFLFGVESAVKSGVTLFAAADNHSRFEIGARLNFERSFVGGQGRFGDDAAGDTEFRSGTTYTGIVADPLPTPFPPKGRTLDLRVSGVIEENPSQPVFGAQKAAFADYVLTLHHAATDNSIAHVYLTLAANSLSMAQAQEVKSAIEHLKGNGKRVSAYLVSASNKNYYIACSADEIVMAPVGYFAVIGLRAEQTFWAGTLEKLGVEFETERIAEYKTATEQFTNREPSEENRQMVNRLLDNLNAQFLGGISQARHLSLAKVQELIDRAPMTPHDARSANLVDRLVYPDEFVKEMRGPRGRSIGLSNYLMEREVRDSWERPPVIGVVVAEGEIGDDAGDAELGSPGQVTPRSMEIAMRGAVANPRVAGMVLRVNSPGGSALASEQIYRATVDVSGRKPSAVSVSGVAASGGYYISSGAEKIFIDPASVTGSIGIFVLKPNLSSLYKKIDLHTETYVRGQNADIMSFAKPFSESERDAVRLTLRELYNRFRSVVAEGRGLSMDSVDAIGRGQVWTGEEALRIGLADTAGGLWSAITYTSQQSAKTGPPQVEIYPRRHHLFNFGGSTLLSPFVRALNGIRGFLGRQAPLAAFSENVAPLLPSSEIQCRLPFDLVVE